MIIDGKTMAAKKIEDLRSKVKELGLHPKLAIVMVGEDPASKIYVDLKVRAAAKVGIETQVRQDLDTDADGIIVQLPGPQGLIDQIPLEKDVDGLREGSSFLPAAVRAVLSVCGDLTNKIVAVVGQGRLVGKPLSEYLEKNKIDVVRCDVDTDDLKLQTLKGDVLVVATGVANLISADMVKPGAVVIDCGSPKAEVDFEKVKDVASAITPVPGGVGPLTVASLLENTVDAAYNSFINHG